MPRKGHEYRKVLLGRCFVFLKMNLLKQLSIISAVGAFIIPRVAFGAWWNPFSWNFFHKKEPVVTEQKKDPLPPLGFVAEKKRVIQKDFDPIEYGAIPVKKPLKIKSDAIKIEQCKTNAEEIKRAVYEETYKSTILSLNEALSAAVIKPNYYIPDTSSVTLIGALETLTYNTNKESEYYRALNDVLDTASTLAKKDAEEKSFTAYSSFYYSCLEE